MIKKTLLIFCLLMSGSSTIKGMEFAYLLGLKKILTSFDRDFFKANAHHFIKIGSGILVYGAYRIFYSRFDDLEELMNEVKQEVERNGKVIGKNGAKLNKLLEDIKKLPTKQQIKKLLELQKTDILKGQMDQFKLFKNGIETELQKIKQEIKLEMKTNFKTIKKEFKTEFDGIRLEIEKFSNTQKKLEKKQDETHNLVQKMYILSLKNHQNQFDNLPQQNFTFTDLGIPPSYISHKHSNNELE